MCSFYAPKIINASWNASQSPLYTVCTLDLRFCFISRISHLVFYVLFKRSSKRYRWKLNHLWNFLCTHSQSTIEFRVFMVLKFLSWSNKINIWFEPISRAKYFPNSLFHIPSSQHLLIFNNIASFKYCFDNHLIYRLPAYHLTIFSRLYPNFRHSFPLFMLRVIKLLDMRKYFRTQLFFRFVLSRINWDET